MFQNSHEVIEYITKRTKRDYGLSEFKQYIEKMGNPQYRLKCIHVGGTNGKGSTTNYLRSILQANGYTVGTFTSPHLESHHDRMRINDVSISTATTLFALGANLNVSAPAPGPISSTLVSLSTQDALIISSNIPSSVRKF